MEPTTTTTGCEHCADPAHRADPARRAESGSTAEAVDTPKARRQARVLVLSGAVLAGAAGALVVARSGAGPALLTAVGTVAGWLLVTAAGLLVLAAARGRGSLARATVLGGLTTAALTPLVCLALALLGAAWPEALLAGAAWLLCGAVAVAVRARAYQRLLSAGAADGARPGAAAAAGSSAGRQAGWWLGQGVAVAAATALLGAVPAAVLVLVPLAVVGAVAQMRGGQRVAARPHGR
ncbi:hypothetical protein MF406_06335 [Georgenia sp. TF02-10]|uniref:hypothetical protein n=1 Tax=Georgenia sp. TF02-10 TaxID=2917725 RepID=UPI001FA80DA5|nr:hypothetical protein [Georgenia sp. TF02-10]UNX55848.1 hypothetical protein MF406_06335 [Georgenia sp. TF02-10]